MSLPQTWPQAQACIVAPERARALLGSILPFSDRASERAVVRRYADAMRRGEWLLNGETIVIDADGTVLDGIRRLRACLAAETGFPAVLVQFETPSGLGPDAFDTGRRRSFADIVSVSVRLDGGALDEAAARRTGWVIAFIHKLLGGGPVASEQLRLMRLERRFRPMLPAALEFASAFTPRMPPYGPADVTLAAVFCLVEALAGPSGIARLEDVLGGPMPALYDKLLRSHSGASGQKLWARILLGHVLSSSDMVDGLDSVAATAAEPEGPRPGAPDPRDPSTAVLEWFVVSPLMAKALLRKMAPNRKLSPGTVEAYAARMSVDDGWRLTGQSLKIDHEGRLFDGQHRCNAAVKAKTGFPSLVVSNLSPDVFPTLDMPRRERHAGDDGGTGGGTGDGSEDAGGPGALSEPVLVEG